MAATTSGQPHPEAGLLIVPKGHSYVHSLRRAIKPIPLKPLTYLHGEPQVIWEQKEVNQMIINENLE
ncbi:hypothetical protein KY285_036336 [Solanum tuberosum]|nr:hypothetical protein KY285_036336 [Solanum tuberosum]